MPKSVLCIALFLLGQTIAQPNLAGTPGPFRPIGPEGYVDHLWGLTFPNPQDSQRLLARTSYDLWASRDGGASWRSLTAHLPPLEGPLRDLVVNPLDPDHFYLVSTLNDMAAVIETRDAGITWSIHAVPAYRAGKLLFDSQTPNVMLLRGLETMLSRDGGRTWNYLSAPPEAYYPTPLASHQGKFYFQSYSFPSSVDLWSFSPGPATWEKIGTSPKTFEELWGDVVRADTFFARDGGDLYRSTDGGRTFKLILSRGVYFGFYQSPWNPSHLAAFNGIKLQLSLDRGTTWTSEPVSYSNLFTAAAAFDPRSGELLFYDDETLVRRRLDGTRVAWRPRGLYALATMNVFVDKPRERLFALSSDGAVFRRDPDLQWSRLGKVDCFLPETIAVPPWDPNRIYVTCAYAFFRSDDGGATWAPFGISPNSDSYPGPTKIAFSSGNPGTTWLIAPFHSLTSPDHPEARRFDIVDAVVHPDPAQGVLAIVYDIDSNLIVAEWKPATGWTNVGSLDRRIDDTHYLTQDERDPNHLLAVFTGPSGGNAVSFDRGRTWTGIGGITPPGMHYSRAVQGIIDPRDSNHLVVGGFSSLSETFDGTTWQFPLPTHRYNYSSTFDGESNLYSGYSDGLLLRNPTFESCADNDRNFCSRQGRFELTVDWKTPNGTTGTAKKVVTGNDESGLFYFFDPNNWELLVKVLDGCSINERFWVFTAGTTDVEYLLKVEDRWTGKVRSYFNQAGKAAEATADIDAFATCSEPVPVGAEVRPAPAATSVPQLVTEAPAPLMLSNGRFEVTANWTNFLGQTGFATPTPLRSDNSGIFWFFSPDNWEVLIKVLDGCAINGHYWVLAAATTNVAYELKIKEPATTSERVYSNPLGRSSPAQIDLKAFRCSP